MIARSARLEVTGYAALVPSLREFADDASDYVVVAATRLLAALGERLQPAQLLYGKRRAFALVPGKPGFSYPELGMEVAGVQAVAPGWGDLPFSDIESVVGSLSQRSLTEAKRLRTASGWLWAALAETDDRMRQFQFAYFGLEVLANQVEAKMKAAVESELSAEIGVPMKELFWPTPQDADAPWRNQMFRFAILAIGLSRGTATDDIKQFRSLSAVRNRLAHGSALEADTLPAGTAIDMLRRYLALAARAEPR